jgi:hypothetical protein
MDRNIDYDSSLESLRRMMVWRRRRKKRLLSMKNNTDIRLTIPLALLRNTIPFHNPVTLYEMTISSDGLTSFLPPTARRVNTAEGMVQMVYPILDAN